MMKWKSICDLLQTGTARTEPVSALWCGIAQFTLATVYVGTGYFGLTLGAFSGLATLVWLPSGIAVAALFLWGYRLLPGIVLGAVLFNLLTAPPLAAIGMSIGSILEALVCTAVLKREKVRPALESLHDVLVLVLAAIPTSALSATLGAGSLGLEGSVAWSSVPATWSAWWLGDMISLFLFTPLLLIWSTRPQVSLSFKRLIELGLLGALVLAVGVFVFLGPFHLNQKRDPTTYLVFLPLIWAALRFGMRGAITALAVLSGLAVVGTVLGVSSFSASNLGERLFYLQSFMAITTITTLLLAAVMAERCAQEERRDIFLSMVSHELRTPLTCLQGYTQLLQRQLAGSEHPRALHALAVMETQTKRLSRLIADLLDLSKIQAGTLTFKEETMNLDRFVYEVAEQLQQTSTQHRICIEGNTLGTIVGDHERLGQVLNNLLTNAIKYSPQAERVVIHLTSSAEYVTISVQDFGIGIPAAQQARVFERFYRVDGRRTAGLGIGLSIAQQIVEHYRGKLWVKSVEGQGSTFSFSLPRSLSL